MPVTTSYPGIYIEELPSTERTIAAAPTSITVFVGYSHPFKTKNPGKPVRIASFTEYERHFGGFFRTGRTPNHLPLAVNQFFLNGGSDAYVVGLVPGTVVAATYTMPGPSAGNETLFTAMEPTDVQAIELTIDNLQNSGKEADITITYGNRAETLRRVKIEDLATVLSGEGASLIKATKVGTGSTAFTTVTKQALRESVFTPVYNATHFTDVFKTDAPLDKVDIFNIMALPGISDSPVLTAALSYCERKYAFFIMDPAPNATADAANDIATLMGGATIPKSANGAIYFPYLMSTDPTADKPDPVPMPPSGFVAGVFARTDNNRGVWKAPAGLETIVFNTVGVPESGLMTDARAGILNNAGVNAIRTFPGVGTVVFGGRSLVAANTAFQQWKYVPVRRMALFLEQTLKRNLGWVVFEPNDEPLWVTIRTSIESFMLSLFRQGAFQGSTPSQAFLVKCDSSTTTQQDINNGVVNILVGFRPLKPAEFVVIKIAQLAGQVQS